MKPFPDKASRVLLASFAFHNPFSASFQQARTLVSIVVGDAAGILFQHRQPHGDVEPVQDVLGLRGDQLGQRAHLLPAIRQERHVLVGLQPLS